jgi:hypothetical protein
LSVDNRAKEICRDINLKVTERQNLDEINNFINQDYQTVINLPVKNIQLWKDQFNKG